MPEYERFDCIVVGGGSAGCAAAAAAAQGGCRTLLVERHGFLGGMGTAAGLSSFINYHYRGRDLSGSFYREIIAGLRSLDATYPAEGGNADIFEPEALKLLLETRLASAGVHMALHSALLNVERDRDDWIVHVFQKSSSRKLRARYLVDATGDADVAARVGLETTHGRSSDGKTQPLSMVLQVAGVNPEEFGREVRPLVEGKYIFDSLCFAGEIQLARSRGEFTIPRESVAMLWSMPWDPGRVTINGTRIIGLTACSSDDMSTAEQEGRRQAWEMAAFLKNYIPGFSRSYLAQTGPQIGVRETRRIVGLKNLTEEDVWQSRQPPDSVVLCSYPIDVHQPDGDGTYFEMDQREYCYGIPLGCLIPRNCANLAVAGRCISATHEAAGSFRVMPTCMTLGEAAGCAVGLAARADIEVGRVRAEDVREEMAALLAMQQEQDSGCPA